MKSLFLLSILLFCIFQRISLKENYAVLVAGSKGWHNYRHQSNIFHLYYLLLKFGWKPENIVTMAFNDIPNSTYNPFPGQIFNKPNGPNVYENFKADYTRYNVTGENFVNICLGNKTALEGIGTGRVLESNENDTVLIFFADHGSDNVLMFPKKWQTSQQINHMLSQMQSKKKFNKLLFYIEACNSGSLFNNSKLDTNLNLWITTSADWNESSYATYCDEEAVVNGTKISACLGGQYATCWLEKLDNLELNMTLEEQYEYIKKCTDKSHATNFGAKERGKDILSEYFNGTNKLKYIEEENKTEKKKYKEKNDKEVYLSTLKYLASIGGEKEKAFYEKELQHEKRSKRIFNEFRNLFKLEKRKKEDVIDFDCYEKLLNYYESQCGLNVDIDCYRFTYFAKYCTMKLPVNNALDALTKLCKE